MVPLLSATWGNCAPALGLGCLGCLRTDAGRWTSKPEEEAWGRSSEVEACPAEAPKGLEGVNEKDTARKALVGGLILPLLGHLKQDGLPWLCVNDGNRGKLAEHEKNVRSRAPGLLGLIGGKFVVGQEQPPGCWVFFRCLITSQTERMPGYGDARVASQVCGVASILLKLTSYE